jgi:hypothetical protein
VTNVIKDITEDFVYDLAVSAETANNYQLSDISFDIAVNNMPFFIAATDEQPYRRESAPSKREQIDQTTEPGEQSFTGWWFRSQSSFHLGAGAKFFEPVQDETLRFRFQDSEGVDIWTKGEISLLKDVDTSHVTTTGSLKLRSIRESNRDEALLLDNHDVDKIYPRITFSINNKALTTNVATLTTTAAHGLAIGMEVDISGVDSTFNGTYRVKAVPTTTTFTYDKTAADVSSTAVSPVGTGTSDVIHFIDYNSGSEDPVYAICDDGTTAYWVTNDIDSGTNKGHVYKKVLTADSTTSDTEMFKINSYTFSAGKVAMEWVKGRIILAADNKVYELTPSSSSLPSPIFTHPNTSYTFTSIAESGAAIYVAGYAGTQSSIYKFTLSDAGAITSLTSAVVSAVMPDGELIYAIKQYLGYMLIGTSKGIRAATVSPDDGSIAYGPLIAETEQPVYDFAFRDRFCWATAEVNGKGGLIRIDLSEQISPLRFAYAHDLFKNVAKNCKAVAFLGLSDRKIFALDTDYNYIEAATRLSATGYLRTGFIRYATIESKYFKFLKVRGNLDNGTIDVNTITSKEVDTFLYNVTSETSNQDLGIARPTGGQEYLAFKFDLKRSTTDNTKGAVMTGYQVKALPAIEKQRLIQFPLYCYDVEMDKYNNIVGSEDDRAFDRISELEGIEKTGNIVTIQDFRTDETYSALIEEIRFFSATPPSERFNGFGGKLLLTVRKL